MSTKFTRSERGQRIDQPDFDRVWRGLVEHDANFVSKFVVGDDAIATSWIVSGFGAVESGGNLVVTRGVGLLGWHDELGSVRYGLVTADGETTRSIPVGSFGIAIYGIYVRFDLTDSEWKTRAKWDALNTTEYVENIPTRLQANWSLTASLVEPGPEWLKIGEYDNTGAGVYTDMRDLFFEGRSADGYEVLDADWGGGNDRSALRASFGIKGIHRFVTAIRRQLQDVIGEPGGGWWSTPILSLYGALARDGRAHAGSHGSMLGHLDPNADNTLQLGDDSTPKRWASAAINQIIAGGSLLGSAANAILPRFSAKMATGQTRTLIFESARDDATVRTVRIYRTTSSAVGGGGEGIEIVYGAYWSNASSKWNIDTDVTIASITSFTTRVSSARHTSAEGANWNDANNPGSDWTFFSQALSTGTIAPSFDADDDGTPGEFYWSSGKSFIKMIPGVAGLSADAIYNIASDTSTLSTLNVLDGISESSAVWPLELPDGCTIDSVVFHCAAHAGGGSVEGNIVRVDISTAGPLKTADVSLPASTATPVVPDIAGREVVDNSTYAYFAWVKCQAATTGKFSMIEVNYTLTKVTLP